MPTSFATVSRRLAAFGLVGAVGTLVHYATLIILVEIWTVDPVAATTLGFGLGALVNYLLNHRYTFNSTKAHHDAGPKFALVAVTTGLLNTLMVHAGVDILGFNYLLVQVVATATVFLLNFVLNSLWTFRESDVP
ncbi:GtrA family protein [Thiocapsa roseopersicina]|uniref:Putative flippase GtrA (Transmembrane translocase of bactoprenol-linked glucose) n=1 Tax=Thiocapsa roseopersicina TaxID=1058 RepID=A0A1H2V740_THIRO|nr:GtrA family protein [Thiocapsa roseopersicina]SDW64146.1 Putative flippase GtrA (transmembrane translocase of bactoprenol-linked glucose) [Thiocapsa roseopersicina]